MRRVDARLNASRIIVVMSRTVGNDENSSGFFTNTAVIRIRIDSDSENARQMSSRKVGSGKMRTTRIAMMPIASASSLRFR
jgi:hypothetical protein